MLPPRDNQFSRPRKVSSTGPAGPRRYLALGVSVVAVISLVLWFGVISVSAGHLAADQPTVGADRVRSGAPLATTATLTSTVTPTVGTPTPSPVPATNCPPAGCPFQPTPTGVWQVDQVFYGQSPPGGGSNQPVLVFIPGLTSIAQDWWTDGIGSNINDMYTLAYNGGYRTAFMNLNQGGNRGPDSTEYVNGNTVFQQLVAITKHYGVGNVVVITHSKGGIDVQDAIAAQTAATLVSEVFMLSAPNLGSKLASIECTPSTTSLSAMCAMTPPLMAQFRSTSDSKLAKAGVPFYMAGGTDHGLPGTALYLGGTFLSQDGSSDGFVPVSSAIGLPGGKYLFVRSYDHDTIQLGHNSFPYIDAILREGTPQPAGSPTPTLTPTPIH